MGDFYLDWKEDRRRENVGYEREIARCETIKEKRERGVGKT